MALIACPECRKQISATAPACPHCGFPNPSKAKDTAGALTPAPPPVSKEDVSDQFPPIPIDAKDSFEAARQIMQHLNRFRASGWTTGDAFAGTDGINKYHIGNPTQKAALQFDLRPTLRRGVSTVLLTMHTLMAGSGLDDKTIDELKNVR